MTVRYLIYGLLPVCLLSTGAFAQEEAAPAADTADALEQAQFDEMGRQDEGDVQSADDGRIAIGLLDEFGKKKEDPNGKFVEFMRDKVALSEISVAEDVKDVPVFLRGFLANRSGMRMAEANQGKLQSLYDEFGMAEEDVTKFKNAKETGKWTGIDVFVRGNFKLNENNGNEVTADVSIVDEGAVYQATVARTQYQTQVNLARKLAGNVEDIILARTPEERQLLAEIQAHKAVIDAANQSYEVNMITLAAGIGATTAGVLGIVTKKYIMGVSGLMFGSVGFGAWILQHSVGQEDRTAYADKTKLYNEKFGDKFAGSEKPPKKKKKE